MGAIMKQTLRVASAAALTIALAYSQPAFATGEIVAPVAATINSGGPGDGSINDTFNQNGLLTTYTSGVTNFDTYIAGNPQHDFVFSGHEWFSNNGTTSASVTYDMGALMGLDEVALWNEDISGIGILDIYGSTDNLIFGLIASYSPLDSPVNQNYGPQVHPLNTALGAIQYLRFDMSNCPQPDSLTYPACAIGEVAFRTSDAAVPGVPEPSSWALMLLGFGAIGFSIRRSRKADVIASQLA